MPNYKHGKIYKIVNESDDVYIGSTTLALKLRFQLHKSMNKRFRLGKGQYLSSCNMWNDNANPHIQLLEECPCDSSKELAEREAHYYQLHKSNCVNKNIPNQSNSEWQLVNQSKIREYHRLYFQKHKQRLMKQTKLYYKQNIESCRAKRRAYARHRRSEFGFLCKSFDSFLA